MDTPRLHPDTIEEVKQRVDIVDVISEHIVLRKRGKDYLGLCPFHEEKTPSFSVSPSKQLYYCFGCGAGGTAFKFLMELGKQSFSEVVLDLARRYQIPFKTLEPEQRQELQRQLSLREQLYEVLALAASFYQHALRQPQGEVALNYLKNERGLAEDAIQQFQLGYAPSGWETLYRYLVEQKRYPVGLVEQAGLIKPRKEGRGYYDYFRDRLMIPISDSQGRIIAFGSRTLTGEEPKYLNSPETPVFDKGKTLFALDRAKQAISQQDKAIVVEGYFDAIALHAAEMTNVVAALGTALSQEQIKQLLRYSDSKQVIFNFDADKAGTKATHRAIAEIEPLVNSGQVQLRILNLPNGKDADEFLRETEDGAQKYAQLVDSAPLWFEWQVQQLAGDRDLQQADGFQQVAREMVKLLNQLEDSHQRTYYIQYCAEILARGQRHLIPIHAKTLLAQLKKPQVRSSRNSPASLARPPINAPANTEKGLLEEAEALLLSIYLHYPEHRQEILDSLDEKDLLFSLSHHRFLWQQILELQERAIEQLNDPSNRLLWLLQDQTVNFPEQMAQIVRLFHLNEKNSEDLCRAPLQIKKAIAVLERVAWDKYRRYCLYQWQQLDAETEIETKQYYFQEFRIAEQRLKELDRLRLVQ